MILSDLIMYYASGICKITLWLGKQLDLTTNYFLCDKACLGEHS